MQLLFICVWKEVVAVQFKTFVFDNEVIVKQKSKTEFFGKISMWRSIGKSVQKIFSNLYKLQKRWIFLNDFCWEVCFLVKFVRPHEFNQSNLRFLVKNTLLNKSHLERFTSFEACINLKKSFVIFFLWNVTIGKY